MEGCFSLHYSRARVCPRPARRLQELWKHLHPSHLNACFTQIFLEAFERHRLIFCHARVYFFSPMRLLKTEINHLVPTYSPSLDCCFICESFPLGKALDEHFPPQEKKKHSKQPNLWKCTIIQAPVTYLNERFKGTFLLEKTWHISLLENSKSIKPSLLWIYFLCWKHPENLLQHRKLLLQKWFKAASLGVGLFPAAKAGEIAGTWSKFYRNQDKDPHMSPCASMLGWMEEKLFCPQVIAKKILPGWE